MNDSILVTGATGKTGKRIVRRLVGRELPLRRASRAGDPRFDWNDPSTWDHILEGVSAAYVIPPGDADTMGRFAERMRAAGVDRTVLLSAQHPLSEHLEIEAAAREHTPRWTILRPTWFSQNFSEDFFATKLRGGELRLNVGDATVGFVDAEDIADVAVAALTEDGHDSRVYELTGPRRLGFDTAVAEIARASGRRLRFVPLSDEDFHREQLAEGMDPDTVDAYGALLRRIRAGDYSGMSDGVLAATGHAPRDFSGYVTAAAASGAWM